MTFPNFPKRSSSKDDALDQALNAWVSGDNHQRHSELVEESPRGPIPAPGERHSEPAEESPREAHIETLITDALEFHRWADETRRTDLAASGPAASTWNRVLRNTAQTTKKGGDMNSAVVRSEPQSAIVYDSRPYQPRNISRYLNLAATIALVSAVVLAGAIAIMRLNQPAGPQPQFAVLGLQSDDPGNGVCDVDALSVDQVIAIVEESSHPTVDPTQGEWTVPVTDQATQPSGMWLGSAFVNGPLPVPDAATYLEAAPVAQEALDCILTGTIGQVWALSDPAIVQEDILRRFPQTHSEDQIRELVESQIELPYWVQQSYADQINDLTITVNPDREMSRSWVDADDEYPQYSQAIFIGWQGADEEGNIVFQDDWSGTTVGGDESQSHGTSLILVQREDTGQWYFRSLHGSA